MSFEATTIATLAGSSRADEGPSTEDFLRLCLQHQQKEQQLPFSSYRPFHRNDRDSFVRTATPFLLHPTTSVAALLVMLGMLYWLPPVQKLTLSFVIAFLYIIFGPRPKRNSRVWERHKNRYRAMAMTRALVEAPELRALFGRNEVLAAERERGARRRRERTGIAAAEADAVQLFPQHITQLIILSYQVKGVGHHRTGQTSTASAAIVGNKPAEVSNCAKSSERGVGIIAPTKVGADEGIATEAASSSYGVVVGLARCLVWGRLKRMLGIHDLSRGRATGLGGLVTVQAPEFLEHALFYADHNNYCENSASHNRTVSTNNLLRLQRLNSSERRSVSSNSSTGSSFAFAPQQVGGGREEVSTNVPLPMTPLTATPPLPFLSPSRFVRSAAASSTPTTPGAEALLRTPGRENPAADAAADVAAITPPHGATLASETDPQQPTPTIVSPSLSPQRQQQQYHHHHHHNNNTCSSGRKGRWAPTTLFVADDKQSYLFWWPIPRFVLCGIGGILQYNRTLLVRVLKQTKQSVGSNYNTNSSATPSNSSFTAFGNTAAVGASSVPSQGMPPTTPPLSSAANSPPPTPSRENSCFYRSGRGSAAPVAEYGLRDVCFPSPAPSTAATPTVVVLHKPIAVDAASSSSSTSKSGNTNLVKFSSVGFANQKVTEAKGVYAAALKAGAAIVPVVIYEGEDESKEDDEGCVWDTAEESRQESSSRYSIFVGAPIFTVASEVPRPEDVRSVTTAIGDSLLSVFNKIAATKLR